MDKPGWKTTEFWFSAVAAIVGLVLASGAITNNVALTILGFVTSALSALGYNLGRVAVKRTALKDTVHRSAAEVRKDSLRMPVP